MKEKNLLSTEKVINLLAKSNSQRHNYLKCIEELAELQEVLIKKVMKQGTTKEPSVQSIVEELGDVAIRISVIADMLDIERNVNERIKEKCKKFAGYLENGLYAGKI